MRTTITLLTLVCGIYIATAQPIDRQAVVTRNNPTLNATDDAGIDTLNALTVGNGGFACTVDITGLQTLPEAYRNGMPVTTMSDWGWHSFPNPENYRAEEALQVFDFGRGHEELYANQFNEGRKKAAADYLRANPHRVNLGALGLDLRAEDLRDASQTLNLWTGVIQSQFTNQHSTFNTQRSTFNIQTVCHPERDMIAAHITANQPVTLVLRFPYPTGKHSDDASDWDAANDMLHHTTLVENHGSEALFRHQIDDFVYDVRLSWESKGAVNITPADASLHTFHIAFSANDVKLTCEYISDTQRPATGTALSFDEVREASARHWQRYWKQGGIVDFSHCLDPRAKELERRVVLSQYLMAVNDAGDTPPQETGLTYNSWFGKFHLEMTWWHLAQFALWGHPELLDRPLSWYHAAAPKARDIAKRQGFDGLRWMKMTDPSAKEAPSKVGSFLIWQQPHLIYLAELLYRSIPSQRTGETNEKYGMRNLERERLLQEYGSLVDETAEMMASFVTFDKAHNRYPLQGCIPAQETLRAAETVNPPFELSYWHFGLQLAQQWRERRGLPKKKQWDDIIRHLSPLAEKDGLYLAAESAPQTYSDIRFTSDHPAVLGAVGILPQSPLVKVQVMRQTFDWIWDRWNWDKTWGWDYPMVAMCAARMGEPQKAVDALLMDKRTNTYLTCGHNYQDQRLRVYLPGNGGLLTAIAMMCAGWDGTTTHNPGFPADGNWDVRWEGLLPLP